MKTFRYLLIWVLSAWMTLAACASIQERPKKEPAVGQPDWSGSVGLLFTDGELIYSVGKVGQEEMHGGTHAQRCRAAANRGKTELAKLLRQQVESSFTDELVEASDGMSKSKVLQGIRSSLRNRVVITPVRNFENSAGDCYALVSMERQEVVSHLGEAITSRIFSALPNKTVSPR